MSRKSKNCIRGLIFFISALLISSCSSGEIENHSDAGDDSGSETAGLDAGTEQDAGADVIEYYDAGLLDEFWGEAPDTDTRIALFDDLWQELADNYAAFGAAPVDWDEIRDRYRPEIRKARGYGRFFALLSRMIAELRDAHTRVISSEICGNLRDIPMYEKRPPVFVKWDYKNALGVCITPLDDNSLLVYKAEPDNPAGLKPGDILLGYDGKTWSENIEWIDERELPLCGLQGTTDLTEHYRKMYWIVANAHLFGELDFMRHGSAEKESISTESLISYSTDILCTDQIGIDSVDFPSEPPNANGTGMTSWGVIPGTNIGYIYIYSWGPEVLVDFETAALELMNTDALIIDQRFNLGGFPPTESGAFAILFNEDIESIMDTAVRADPDDYLALEINENNSFGIDADESTFYDNPIAVLQGPKAGSGGDMFPYLMSYHPRVRRFGRPTQGHFSAMGYYWNPDPYLNDLQVGYAMEVMLDMDGNLLHGTLQYPEEKVWLDPDDAADGIDTVIESALKWIESEQ